ncbi:MAG: thioredoxin family protein [Saprospiraceae bacterium]
MRRISVLIVTILISMNAIGGGIKFHKGDWASALAAAKAQDKLIFMDCYTTWCGPCKAMARKVFPDAKVGEFFNANFINVKMDMEKGEGKTLAKQFRVRAYPTLLFVDGSGKVVHKEMGAKPADRFLSLGKTAVKKFDKSLEYTAQYEKGERGAAFLLKYAYALQRSNKPYARVVNEYLATQTNLTSKENLKAIFDLTESVDSRIFKLMTKHKSAILALDDYSKSDYNEKVLKAANNTIAKGIEFREESLVSEAKTAVSRHISGDEGKKFGLKADITYTSGIGNEKGFMKVASKYIKKYAKNNAVELDNMSKKVLEVCKETKSYAKAGKWSKKAVEYGGLSDYYLTYAYLLANQNKIGEALKIAKKGKSIAKENKKATSSFDALITQLKA